MKKALFKIIKYLLAIVTIITLVLFLFPKKYNVPEFQKRSGTKYWNLSTGSIIGYTYVAAKGLNKKPYPIIYLQGGPGGPIFNSNIEILSRLAEAGYDVYLYDLVGCGHSNRLSSINDYTVDRHKRDLEEIIKKIGAEKVILIGQSWGAMLATCYLADNPTKVDKLIYTGPGPILPIKYDLEGIQVPDSLHLKLPIKTNAMGRAKAYNIRTKFIEFVAKAFGCKLASDNEMDNFATYLNFEMNKSTVVDTTLVKLKSGYGYYVNIMTPLSFDNVTDKRSILAKSKVPILLMKGQYDSIKWGYTAEYLKIFRNLKLVIIPNAGHSISAEQPEIYIKTITAFLNE